MLGRRVISFDSNTQTRCCTHAVYQSQRSLQTCQEVRCSSILVGGGIEFNLPERNLQRQIQKIKVLTH